MNRSAYVWPKKWPRRESPIFSWFISQYLALNNLVMASVKELSLIADEKEKEKSVKYANMCVLRNVKNKVPLQWYGAGDAVSVLLDRGTVLAQLGFYCVVKLASGYGGDIIPPLYTNLALDSWIFPMSSTEFAVAGKKVVPKRG